MIRQGDVSDNDGNNCDLFIEQTPSFWAPDVSENASTASEVLNTQFWSISEKDYTKAERKIQRHIENVEAHEGDLGIELQELRRLLRAPIIVLAESQNVFYRRTNSGKRRFSDSAPQANMYLDYVITFENESLLKFDSDYGHDGDMHETYAIGEAGRFILGAFIHHCISIEREDVTGAIPWLVRYMGLPRENRPTFLAYLAQRLSERRKEIYEPENTRLVLAIQRSSSQEEHKKQLVAQAMAPLLWSIASYSLIEPSDAAMKSFVDYLLDNLILSGREGYLTEGNNHRNSSWVYNFSIDWYAQSGDDGAMRRYSVFTYYASYNASRMAFTWGDEHHHRKERGKGEIAYSFKDALVEDESAKATALKKALFRSSLQSEGDSLNAAREANMGRLIDALEPRVRDFITAFSLKRIDFEANTPVDERSIILYLIWMVWCDVELSKLDCVIRTQEGGMRIYANKKTKILYKIIREGIEGEGIPKCCCLACAALGEKVDEQLKESYNSEESFLAAFTARLADAGLAEAPFGPVSDLNDTQAIRNQLRLFVAAITEEFQQFCEAIDRCQIEVFESIGLNEPEYL